MTLQEKLEDATKRAQELANDDHSSIADLETAMGEVRSVQAEIREEAKQALTRSADDSTKKDSGDEPEPEVPTDDKDKKDESEERAEEPEDDKTDDTQAADSTKTDETDKKDKQRAEEPGDDTAEPADDDPETRSAENKGGNQVTTKLTGDKKKEAQVRSVEDYIRTGVQTRAVDGVVDASVGVMVPEQIIYDPNSEVDSVFDLSTLITKTNVTTASGKYPILKRADAKMVTVKELEDNPALAKPAFQDVEWSIDTYRGAIPISEESIQDTQVPLMPIIQKNAGEQRVNTLNAGISAILKGFTGVSVKADATIVDSMKQVLNVSLDPAYNKTIVVTQSAYQLLDTLKDNQGRYLMQQDVTSATGMRLLGKTLVIVNDELLGEKAGDVAIFIGDLARGVLMPNRVDTSIEWNKSEIYGRYLALVMRFGLTKADEKAGYMLTTGTTTTTK